MTDIEIKYYIDCKKYLNTILDKNYNWYKKTDEDFYYRFFEKDEVDITCNKLNEINLEYYRYDSHNYKTEIIIDEYDIINHKSKLREDKINKILNE